MMPSDEYDFRKALVSYVTLLQAVQANIASSIDARPVGQRDELEMIHERVSSVIGIMKSDLQRLS